MDDDVMTPEQFSKWLLATAFSLNDLTSNPAHQMTAVGGLLGFVVKRYVKNEKDQVAMIETLKDLAMAFPAPRTEPS